MPQRGSGGESQLRGSSEALPPKSWRVLKAARTTKGGSFKLSFSDKTLTCKDCGQEFTWTAGEQEFYSSRGLMNEPGRCPTCRAARRASGGMGGGGGAYGGSRGMGGPREVFTATFSYVRGGGSGPVPPPRHKPGLCSSC